jgi:hypothetical protein
MNTIHCDFCGLDFNTACAEPGCQGCPVALGCSRITCPRCGYSILPEAALIGWLRGVKAAWTRRNTVENQ